MKRLDLLRKLHKRQLKENGPDCITVKSLEGQIIAAENEANRKEIQSQMEQGIKIEQNYLKDDLSFDEQEAGDDEEEVPEVGEIVDGQILVCRGDDRPEECITWLQSDADELNNYLYCAEENNVELYVKEYDAVISDEVTFYELIGIDCSSSFWEGSLTSGHLVLCWVKPSCVDEVIKKSRELLDTIYEIIEPYLEE
ncbi:MAG: hypothetical protein AB2689_21090 [Candidatus Thiodiazotropha taylori]